MTNENYITVEYPVEILVPKSPNDVFNHLIDLKNWWPEKFEGETLKLNSDFILSSGDSHESKNKVVEFEPDKALVWLTIEGIRKTDNFEWTGTKMIFKLSPQGQYTRLKFIYDGVVLKNESERLIQICDMTIKDLFYNFIVHGKNKGNLNQ